MFNHPLYKHDYSPGNKYGQLTIISREGKYAYCDCECGKSQIKVQARALGTGNTKSCGCLQWGETNTNYRHGARVGGHRTRLYEIWTGMRKRAGTHEYYEHIAVCQEWNDFETFKTWALNNGYSDCLQIDRVKNKLGYSPVNCRWVTPKQQSQNRRKLFRSNTSGYSGVSKAGSKSKPWHAYYCVNSKIIRLGNFKTPLAAHRARLKFIRGFQHEQSASSN